VFSIPLGRVQRCPLPSDTIRTVTDPAPTERTGAPGSGRDGIRWTLWTRMVGMSLLGQTPDRGQRDWRPWARRGGRHGSSAPTVRRGMRARLAGLLALTASVGCAAPAAGGRVTLALPAGSNRWNRPRW
jgi:hypothetical protein